MKSTRIPGSPNGLHRWLWILLSLGLGGWLRWQAAQQLPVEADEPLYLRVAYLYSRALCAQDPLGILRVQENLEHPPLVKLLYSIAWPCGGADLDLLEAIRRARWIATIFGTLAAGTLAAVHPWAGILMAVHPTTVHYTSVAMLESAPLFLVSLALLAVYRSRSAWDRWFWIFVVTLGITAASKYIYAMIPIVFSLQVVRRWGIRSWGFGLAVAAVLFIALDLPLWASFQAAGLESLIYHLRYAQSSHVAQARLPWYQPIRWLCPSVPEGGVFLAGVLGAIRGIRKWGEKSALPLTAALAFLLLWPTKWPHYTLIAIPLLSLAAAFTLWEGSLLRSALFVILALSLVVNHQRLARRTDLPYTASPPSSTLPAPAILDGIQLDSARIWCRGREVHALICWRPQRAFPAGYSMFLHLLGEVPHPTTGSPIWDQWDGPALDGAYASSLWIPGVRFCETHTLRLPDFAPRGRYMLTTGWYRWETGQRVSLLQGPTDPRYPDAVVLDRCDMP